MDIPITQREIPYAKYGSIGFFALLIVILIYQLLFVDFDSKRVSKEKLRIGRVQEGNFEVEVAGSGSLLPRDVEWVVPRVSGRVTNIAVMAGDIVEKGQILLELNNDKLKSSMARMESRYAQARAILAAKTFDLDKQRMNYESELLKANFELKEAEAFYQAQKKLVSSQNSPISRLEFTKTAVRVDRMRALVQFAEKSLTNFEQLRDSQLAEYKARVEEVEEEKTQLREQFESLSIRVNKSGVVHDLDIKLGQMINEGELLAKIIDPADIYVKLKVPAYQSLKLAKGQLATIKLHSNTFQGVVERIDPNVKGTTIDVDISLNSKVPGARVDMYVSGTIHVQSIGVTLFVERPANSIENSVASVYKLNSEEDEAQLTSVEMGAFSANYVQVISGLEKGEKIILSDLNEYNGYESLTLY